MLKKIKERRSNKPSRESGGLTEVRWWKNMAAHLRNGKLADFRCVFSCHADGHILD